MRKGNRSLRRGDSGSEAATTTSPKNKDLTLWRLPGNSLNPHLVCCFGAREDLKCDFSYGARSPAMHSQANMSTNSSVDHCKTPDQVTYEILSWVMVVQFILGLPLNLSVLYIFIFRYDYTQSVRPKKPNLTRVSKKNVTEV